MSRVDAHDTFECVGLAATGAVPDALEKPVYIAGLDTQGFKRPIRTNGTGSIRIDGSIVTGGANGAMTTVAGAVSEVKAGASALAQVREVTFHCPTVDHYWGYSSGVTTINGTLIYAGQMAQWLLSAGVSVFVIPASGASNDCRVTEGPIL